MQTIDRSQLVTVNLPAALAVGGRVFFPDVPELREREVYGAELFDVTRLAASPDGVASASVAQAANLVLVLTDKSDQRLREYPLNGLNSNLLAGIYKTWTPFRVNWQQSYVLAVGAVGGVSVNLAVFFH